MAVEVVPGAVVVGGGPGVGMAGGDLGVAERNAGVEGVGDRRVTQRVRADPPRDAGLARPGRPSGRRRGGRRQPGAQKQDQGPVVALAAAGLEGAEDGDGERHGGGLVALADEAEDAVAMRVSA